MTDKLLIIGCGNMAGAMLAGWLAAGEPPTRFEVLSRGKRDLPEGVAQHFDAGDVSDHNAVMLGFKPQQLSELAPGFQELVSEGVVVYSLLAGITLEQLRDAFPDAQGHVRVMPNLASRIGKSPVILAESGLDQSGRDAAFALFDQLGMAVWQEDEGNFDLATALAGSGPGFVYRFIDALAGAAEDLGLEQDSAQNLAVTMVEGASSLAARADVSPGELADQVASPGGMTREGLNVLDDNAILRRLLTDTLRATRDKGEALSKGA